MYKTKSGYRLSVCITENDTVFFDELDNVVVEYIKKHNSEWFDNELKEDEIEKMYNETYCRQNRTIDVDITDKTLIYMNDSLIDVDDIIDKLSDKNIVVDFRIKYIGLNIYNDCVRNRWDIASIMMNYVDDIVTDNKDTIEDFWKCTVEESILKLDEQISKLVNKKQTMNKLIADLKKCEKQDKIWDAKIHEIKGFVQNIIFQR